MKELYLGVMSGTSLDGVDVALCEIDDATCKLIASYEHPFPKTLKEEILRLLANKTTLKAIGTLDVKLGKLFADAINTLIQREKLLPENIKAIGLHGQTLWHEPDADYPFSMQLGDPNIVAAQTNITTIADFRRMDIANGGQGAPFAPAFHQFLFAQIEGNIAVVNIGGMANISLLFGDSAGWDVGCGNVLMDFWMQKTQHKDYDKAGNFAKSSTADEKLLAKMLEDAYFKKQPPKSTGREYFNKKWLETKLQGFEQLSDAQIQRTLLELTAHAITNDINATKTTKLIVCGGGAKNCFLLQRLRELCHIQVTSSDTLGISSDFLEAMAFAWFAKKRVHKETLALSSVTGSTKNSIAGAIYAAN